MTGVPKPPRLATRLLGLLLPEEDRDAILGDLEEEFLARTEHERHAAHAWYWRQTMASLIPAAILRLRRRSDRIASARRREGEKRMQTLAQDLRHSLRLVIRYPMFALMVVLTLGLGIGANTIVFSVVDGMVLNPFPYPETDRLIGVGPEYPRLGQEVGYWEVLSAPEFMDIRDRSRTLEREIAWDMGNRQVTIGDATENLFTAFWWGDAFATLGVAPTLGRGFLAEEIDGNAQVAILSHRVWQNRFGGDPALLGSAILVNGEPYTLVGVMPERTLIYGTDLWTPMRVGPEVYPRQARQFQMLARMAPGATREQVDAELATIARQIEQENLAANPEYEGWRLVPATWQEINVAILRPAAVLLMGAVAFVLLLVCANVATLLLVRATARRGELALRTALGAGRTRLLRQLLTESVLLALVGGIVGTALGWLGVRALTPIIASMPVLIPGEPALNLRVLGFSLAVSLGAGVLFGILPALHGTRLHLTDELKSEGAATTGSARRLRLQHVFVGIEVALAVVLLVGGGLLVHSLLRLQSVDPGFEPAGVLTMRMTLADERYDDDGVEAFFAEAVRRVETIPGVASAATGSQFPPGVFTQEEVVIEGSTPAADGMLPTAFFTTASPGYVETLEIPLERGRTFTDADVPGGPMAVVINRAMADRYFPGEDPIGRRIRLDDMPDDAPWLEIVGVVGSTRNVGLAAEPAPEIFASSRQYGGTNNQQFLLVRTLGEPRSILPAVRRGIAALDPDQPVYLIRTLEEAYAVDDALRRISAMTLGLLAAFSLALASIGIYGLISFAVGQRRREVGVRLALGADAGQVRWMVVRNAFLPVGVGLLVGLAAAFAVTGTMSSLLYEVSGTDPATFVGVTLLLLAVALVAAYLPARSISRLDPVAALRQDA